MMSEKILVVEDEIALQETLAYNLKHQGYTVENRRDGTRALELAREIQPRPDHSGYHAARIDGFEVCRILRQR